ncbi:unnamed protein product (macronuclear) [Paramecium tetraurelia]|uniref:Palmitoyltransferase n=1 Tax=Paramecium tetraurelia TaxID=5888 RepID=A0C5W4_PARTE|nr:uncharacterized protein GSPATT00035310001 [Paramecium tetraurelia]CAK66181.1 unnamed protein product [Paramecium tetraurelia]|eukprot:XP_001433578.1 hypothetical protein (macronuclear) [Paramecium tetraurelia strain d4-2]
MKYYREGQLLRYIGTWIPLGILVLIVLYFYVVYMETYLMPLIKSEYVSRPIVEINTYLIQLVHINDYVFSNKTIGITITLHIILILFTITLIRVVMTIPGHVPVEWLNKIENEIRQMIENEENMINHNKKGSQTSTSFSSEIDDEQRLHLNVKVKNELIDKQGRRHCKNCSTFKPKRCHHCRQCKTCWLKMDHHCQWLNNCIGYGNYKLFINLLCYAWSLISFILITYSRCYYDTMNSYSSDAKLFLVSFTFLYCCFLWILLTAFTLFHLWAIKSNITTLEYCENKPREPLQKGVWNNIFEVFGKNPLVWFLPIQPDTKPILD